jgi:hypothetical protein
MYTLSGKYSCISTRHIQIGLYPKPEFYDTINYELVVEKYTKLQGSFDLFVGTECYLSNANSALEIKFGIQGPTYILLPPHHLEQFALYRLQFYKEKT